MKEDITKILENDSLLLKAFGCLFVLSFWLIPGGLFLLLEKSRMYFEMELPKLIFTSFILSMPFNIIGFIMVFASFMANPKSQNMPVKFNIWSVLIISYLWGCLNVGILYINTRLPFNPTNYFYDLNFKENYVINYVFMALFMGFSLAKKISKERSTASNNK